ncbi:MAG TPA: hypothetical protein VKB93_11690 [Thermoanaerobaculia bacterium]|nr:hypothetical protein [Thermoanaerobaculia bacterium]
MSNSQSGGYDRGGQLSKEQVLDALRKEGITNIDQLADFAAKKSSGTGKAVAAAIIGPHWFVTA